MLVFGHRGARGEAPENTLAGFEYARRHGVAGLELDVRLSADGQLVVIHDATVDRTTGATGLVSGYTAAALAQLDARGSHTSWPQRVGVPTLAEVLDAHAPPAHRAGAPPARLAIEVKTDTPERLERVCAALVEQIDRHGIHDTVTVTSFDPLALEIMRRLAPVLPRAYIGAYDTPASLETALRLDCRQADVPLARGSQDMVHRAQAHGLRVVGWLGNSEAELEALVRWGVDGITSDYPTRAVAFLRARGLATDTWD